MPEILIRRTPLVTAIQTYYDAVNAPEIIGLGGDCAVTPHLQDPKKVCGITYQTQNRRTMLTIYYTQRIYHTLFPSNFPRINGVFWSFPEEAPGQNFVVDGTVRQRIVGSHFSKDEHNQFIRSLNSRTLKNRVIFQNSLHTKEKRPVPLLNVFAACERYDIPAPSDLNSTNMMTTPDGYEYYIDTLLNEGDKLASHISPDGNGHLTGIKEYLEDNYFPKREKEIVAASFRRLKEVRSTWF